MLEHILFIKGRLQADKREHREAVVMDRKGYLSVGVSRIQANIRWIWHGGRRCSKEAFGNHDPDNNQARGSYLQPLLRQGVKCEGEPPLGTAGGPRSVRFVRKRLNHAGTQTASLRSKGSSPMCFRRGIMNVSKRVVGIGAIFLIPGCAPVQRYRPSPLAPAETASSLAARSLNDPGLRRFIEQNLGHELNPWPPQAWDLHMLTLAAFYFNPALDAARARAAAAEAAMVTAGARPNPTITLTPGVPSPYLLGVDFQVPIETAGKRGYRLEEASNLSEAASST